MNIRKKTIILQGAGLLLLSGLAGACSNVEDGFYVNDKSSLRLSISPQNLQSGVSADNARNLSVINAVNGSDKVLVNTQANWKVEVVNDNRPPEHSEWTLYVDEIVNDSTGSYFTFSSSINIQGQREWPSAFKIYVEGGNGEELVPQYLTIRQDASMLVPSKTSFDIFPAGGGSDVINVTASIDWDVKSDAQKTAENPDGWIELVRNGDKVDFAVLPNTGTSIRMSNIRFVDGTGKSMVDINVTQSAAENVFSVSPDQNTISKEAATLTLKVLSDEKWKVECAEAGSNGWLSIGGLNGVPGVIQEVSVGEAGGAGTELQLNIQANPLQSNRTATLLFSREDGVKPVLVRITQAGTEQPALSTPWISGLYEMKGINLYARYFSVYPVEAKGIEITDLTNNRGPVRVADTTTGDVENESGLVYVRLNSNTDYDGLQYRAGNRYEIRAYILTESKEYVSESMQFTVPGSIPSGDDQQLPVVN